MTLPKMKPTPMPGPMVPRPASTSPDVPAWAMTGRTSAVRLTCCVLLSLMLFGDGAAEVDRREGGEDERLQGRHQADLEDEERDRDGQRDDAECRDAEDDHQ